VKETLPGSAADGGGAMHAAGGPNGTLLVGGYRKTGASKQSVTTEPVAWTRTGTTWSAPTAYTQTGDQGTGWGIAGNGRMIGRVTDGKIMAWGVWDTPSLFTTLSAPYLQTINSAGTVAVGVLPSGGPALWYRNVTTGLWNPTAVALPTGCADGSAQDINDDGVVVGYACGKAAVWRINASVSPPAIVSGPLFLVGFGGHGTNSGARADAVTNTYPYVVAGRAQSNGAGLLVKWIVE
jgi:hypothetical protein